MKNRETNMNGESLEIGDLLLDPQAQQASRAGRVLDLPGLSYRLLECLAAHWPETVSRRDIQREVWGETIVSDDAVRQRVRLLRIGLGRPDAIVSIKGVGYRLNETPLVHDRSRRNSTGFSRPVMAMTALLIIVLTVAIQWDFVHGVKHFIRHALP